MEDSFYCRQVSPRHLIRVVPYWQQRIQYMADGMIRKVMRILTSCQRYCQDLI